MVKNDKATKDLWSYWRRPESASQLSEEQRKKLAEKFLKLVEKSKDKNAERMRKIINESHYL